MSKLTDEQKKAKREERIQAAKQEGKELAGWAARAAAVVAGGGAVIIGGLVALGKISK